MFPRSLRLYLLGPDSEAAVGSDSEAAVVLPAEDVAVIRVV